MVDSLDLIYWTKYSEWSGRLEEKKLKLKNFVFVVGAKPGQNYADFLVIRKASPQTERN